MTATSWCFMLSSIELLSSRSYSNAPFRKFDVGRHLCQPEDTCGLFASRAVLCRSRSFSASRSTESLINCKSHQKKSSSVDLKAAAAGSRNFIRRIVCSCTVRISTIFERFVLRWSPYSSFKIHINWEARTSFKSCLLGGTEGVVRKIAIAIPSES